MKRCSWKTRSHCHSGERKRGSEITVPKDMDKAEVEKLVMEDDAVQRALQNGPLKKLIVVPGRIVNVVI